MFMKLRFKRIKYLQTLERCVKSAPLLFNFYSNNDLPKILGNTVQKSSFLSAEWDTRYADDFTQNQNKKPH